MKKLGIKRIPTLKSILYEVSILLGRVIAIDTENNQTHKYGNEYVRVCKSGIHLTNKKLNHNVEDEISMGTWFSIKVTNLKDGRVSILLQEIKE